jgi:predicted phage terminase large subunit-like protein
LNLSTSTEAQRPSIETLAQELYQRRQIRQSLTELARHVGFEPAKHQRLLIAKLEAVARGEIKRLAVFMPPGAGKSFYSSYLFPAWYLAGHPGTSLIAASHTTNLAEVWGRRVRNLTAENAAVLDARLAADSQAAGRWMLANGSEYYAAGVGQAIVGFRASGGIIDDPVRGQEDADSELIRNKVWEWFQADFTTRLKPGGFVILIQTRWHEDDLAGRILARMESGGEQWDVLTLPAVAEENDALGRKPGEYLWDDDSYGYADDLKEKRKNQSARNWAALFQQRPAPVEGDFFKAQWFRPYDRMPRRSELVTYGASDYAMTAGGGDYTVHMVVGIDADDRMYLLDIWRKQAAVEQWVESLADMVHAWKPMGWAEEQVQITSGVGPYLERRLRERKPDYHREQFPTRGDKGARAQSIRARMATNGLYVPVGKSWYEPFRSELLAFPAGRHDDQVDALGLIGQLLDKMIPAQRIVKPKPANDPGYYVVSESEIDRYARTGSAGTDWSAPAEDGEVDYSIHWKAM